MSKQIIILVNCGDEDEIRDQQARDLFVETQEWPGVTHCELSSTSAGAGSRGDMLLVGQLAMQVLPGMLDVIFVQLLDWLKRRSDRKVEIEIDGAKAVFPSDISSHQLASWIQALKGIESSGVAIPNAIDGNLSKS